MDYQYLITKDQYLTALEFGFKERLRALPWRIFLFLTTIGQMLIFAAIILTRRPEGRELYIFAGSSLMLAALSCCYFFMTDWQAKADLQKLTNSGAIIDEFWQSHRIVYQDRTVHIKYGKKDIELQTWACRVLRYKGLVLIMNGNSVIEAIPESQLNTDIESFICVLRDSLGKSAARSAQTAAAKLSGRSLGTIEYSYEPGDYAAQQCAAKRRLYLSHRSFSLVRILMLALCLFIVYYTAVNFTVPGLLSCIMLCLLIFIKPILIFSPGAEKRIERDNKRLSDFYPGDKVTLHIFKDELVFNGEFYCLGIPLSEITAHFEHKGTYCIFTQKGACFTIPESPVGSENRALLSSILGR